MNNEKVCIIHKVGTLDPRSFYKQGRSLVAAGYGVTILGLFEKSESVQGIRLVGFRQPKRRLYRFLMTNSKIFIRAVKEKAEIYHFHDLDFILWAVLIKMVTRSKVVYDIHEAHPEYMLIKTYIPKQLRKVLYLLVYIMEHFSTKVFDAIVPNDNFIAQDFNHKKNVVVFNFPTLDLFKHTNGTPWDKKEYDLFYHGSMPRYHFEAMMKIAQKLNDDGIKNLWGIVTNDTETIQWAEKEIKKQNVHENFEFLPYTDYLNIHSYLTNSRIGIVPLPQYKKFMKNIPLKLFEFMGFGMPVVLSDLPPSRQFIDGKDCAIAVRPDNYDEYAEAIKLLLNNPVRAMEMGRNGKKLVFDLYNWRNEEVKLLGLYDTLTRYAHE